MTMSNERVQERLRRARLRGFIQRQQRGRSAGDQRTYEIGPRYVLRHDRWAPYAKVMYGRGVFNYPPVNGDPKIGPAANLAYNIIAIGGGVDYHVIPTFNVRAEYEYQQWLSFPPNGLTPKIFSIGVAYRLR